MIGRELAVDYLLEGAIRTEGSRVFLTSRLIRAADQVRSGQHGPNGSSRACSTSRKNLVPGIAEQIRVRLSAEQLNTLGRRQTTDSVTYKM